MATVPVVQLQFISLPSDVTLIADDGKRFHGHRLVLCVQSPVFKSMLDSDLWVESKNKEVWHITS